MQADSSCSLNSSPTATSVKPPTPPPFPPPTKQRFTYEQEVQANPLNYDTWFDYVRLEEGAGDAERVRDVYERAVANIPPGAEKR
jgi:hypothetical protein